ncbi:MAG TPA: hypothetical protein VFW92_01755, partial [Candidatus Limnocylindrales bacterium]|nr:hypothetical protein [Candidatus Limnocylindrales bacterium]
MNRAVRGRGPKTDPKRRSGDAGHAGHAYDAVVTSLHNPRLRAAAALRERRARTREGRFLVDGTREIGRALDAGFA